MVEWPASTLTALTFSPLASLKLVKRLPHATTFTADLREPFARGVQMDKGIRNTSQQLV